MRVILLCHHCAKPFSVCPSIADKTRYCSRPCEYTAKRVNQMTAICQYCNKTFIVYASTLKKGAGKHCSQDCYNKSRANTQEKLWKLVAICQHGKDCPYCCWPWQGTLMPHGYGIFSVNRKNKYVQRLIWEDWHQKSMPSHLFAAHYCHVKACASPSHIHPATQKENMADSMRDNRLPKGPTHWRAKKR
jgi:HNH endonuclease